MRQYVSNIRTEGLEVSTDGNTLTISAGTITLPGAQATLQEDQVFTFLPEDALTNILIAFDRFGRLFVEWNTPKLERAKSIICQHDGTRIYIEQQASAIFGIATHLVYFDLPAGEVDLSRIIINVVRGRAA